MCHIYPVSKIQNGGEDGGQDDSLSAIFIAILNSGSTPF